MVECCGLQASGVLGHMEHVREEILESHRLCCLLRSGLLRLDRV